MAAAAAGLVLPLSAVMSLSSGTLAQQSDTIVVNGTVGVAGTPRAISRGVSIGVNHQHIRNGFDQVSRSASIDSRNTTPIKTAASPLGQEDWNTGGVNLSLKNQQNINACASSNRGGTNNRCSAPGNPNGWGDGIAQSTTNSSLADASSGGAHNTAGTKYGVRIQNPNMYWTYLEMVDIWTAVRCNADGTVHADAPRAAWNMDTGHSDWRAGTKYPYGWFHTPVKNAMDIPENTWGRYENKMWGNWNVRLNIEIHSIRKTFSNPPRALSAIVAYRTDYDGGWLGDYAFVSKSECAVSPDGSVPLSENIFGPLFPPIKRLPNGTAGNQRHSTGPVSDPVTYARQTTQTDERLEELGLDFTGGELEVLDPLTGEPGVTSEDPEPTDTTTPGTTPAATTPRSTPVEESTTATTSTSAGPDPDNQTYVAPAGGNYRMADGSALTTEQRELVDAAIAAASDDESGELPGGASYATAEFQLDGSNLIVTTADGAELRIRWEK